MRRLALILGTIVISLPAVAAGIDSRLYTCADLQSQIAARRFLFISQATFGDFAVADVSVCSGGQIVERRSVATRDSADCPINYCVYRGTTGGGGN